MPRKYRTFKRKPKYVPRPVKAFVKKAIAKNIENKFRTEQATTNFSSIGNAWVEVDLTDMAQGGGIGQRIGNEIKLKAFSLRGTLVGGQNNLATDDNRNTVRIVLALWDASSVTPLQTNGAGLNTYIGKRTNVSKGLLKKYIDKIIELPTAGRDSTGYLPAMKMVKMFVKLNSFVKYYGSASTADNKKLILSIITDSALVSHPGFTNGYHTMFYEDA